MHSRVPAGLIALATGLLVLILSGCGSTTATIDPVAEAAVATSQAGGAQMSMRARMEIEGLGGPITMTGSGDFNFARKEGEIVSNLTGLPAGSLGALKSSSLHFTELFANDALYMESPLFAGKLPGGARWMKLDLAKLAQGAGLDPQSLSSGQSNPAQVLNYLKAGGGSVSRLGTAVVRGTKTTRYRGTIDLAKALERSSSSSPAQVKSAIQKLFAAGATAKIPVEVWVDRHNLVRRMTMTLAETPAGHRLKVLIAMELFNFGATPTVNVPADGEVFDATGSSLSALSTAG